MEIQGSRITLRPITLEDLPNCVRWAGNQEIMQHTTGKTFTEEEERQWLEEVLQNEHEKVFAILNEEHTHIGTCGIHLRATNTELSDEEGVSLGIMIGEMKQWGKGYGPEAIRVLADYAHREYGAKRVWLTVDTIHERAIRAYEKAGFQKDRIIKVPERIISNGEQWIMDIRYT